MILIKLVDFNRVDRVFSDNRLKSLFYYYLIKQLKFNRNEENANG